MKFAIFTHVEHTEREGQYFAYAPYVREMNLWLKHAKEVEIVAPLPPNGKADGQAGYQHKNLTLTRIPSFHFLDLSGAVSATFKIPKVIFKIFGAMSRADHLHLRCPGNVGLLACICQIFFPSKPKTAKYAGNWDPKAKQPWTYKFQRWILTSSFLTKNIKVLVYGELPRNKKNLVSFFTASFSEKEIPQIEVKDFSGDLIILFVGNLVEGKQPLEAIKMFHQLIDNFPLEKKLRMEIYGEGPEGENLMVYCEENKLSNLITFRGNRPLDELKATYQKAHFIILPSKSEGWPKAIAEGMFFGCIPIATPVSCVPWMLGFGKRGILLKTTFSKEKKKLNGKKTKGKKQGEPQKIFELLSNPKEMEKKSLAAKNWSQKYTLERFEEEIKEVQNFSAKKDISPTTGNKGK